MIRISQHLLELCDQKQESFRSRSVCQSDMNSKQAVSLTTSPRGNELLVGKMLLPVMHRFRAMRTQIPFKYLKQIRLQHAIAARSSPLQFSIFIWHGNDSYSERLPQVA